MTQDQATAFDPFKGFGPKIKIRKTGDHGQRNDQRARPVHEVPGDQHRPDPEEWLGRARTARAVVREVLDPVEGDEPEAEAPGEPPTGRPAPGVDIVEVDDPRWFQRAGEHPWPAKFTRFRPDQLTATEQIIEAYEAGAKVVMLDAPTGSGKTLVAEMVRRRLATKSLFVCSGKQLQDQFVADFGEYARVLKGRSNYPTATMPYPEYTGDDCTGRGCRFCPTRAECPYQHAKVQAMTATVGVLNTSYLLAEANTAGTFGEKEVKGRMTRRPFIVVDEADTLEGALMGYVEFKVSARLLEDLGLQPPVKAARTKTVQAWIGSLVSALEVRVEAMQDWDESDVALMRRKRGVQRVLDQARGIELGNDEDPDGWGDWIRVYETKWDPKAREERDVPSFVLKPVVVNDWGMDRLWRHSDKWLIMSATIISPDEMAESLGLDQAGVPWAVVRMPMPFAKENRPIVMKPVANITYQEAAVEKPKMLAGIAEILDRYEGENILVHTVSYSLTKYLADGLLKERQKGRWNRGRQILAYSNAKERDAAVEAFNRTGGVLLAPSLDRGLDLPGDLCRVVVVAKVPFPALGDRQVSERLRRPGGQVWYGVQVARSLVQMTGRGVRHENDWATTFILDKQFPRFFRESGRKLLPDWWIEALTNDRK